MPTRSGAFFCTDDLPTGPRWQLGKRRHHLHCAWSFRRVRSRPMDGNYLVLLLRWSMTNNPKHSMYVIYAYIGVVERGSMGRHIWQSQTGRVWEPFVSSEFGLQRTPHPRQPSTRPRRPRSVPRAVRPGPSRVGKPGER